LEYGIKAKENKLSTRTYLKVHNNNLIVEVINNVPLTEKEYKKISERIEVSSKYDNIAEFFLENPDPEAEGMGLGLSMIVVLLKNINISHKNFVITTAGPTKPTPRSWSPSPDPRHPSDDPVKFAPVEPLHGYHPDFDHFRQRLFDFPPAGARLFSISSAVEGRRLNRSMIDLARSLSPRPAKRRSAGEPIISTAAARKNGRSIQDGPVPPGVPSSRCRAGQAVDLDQVGPNLQTGVFQERELRPGIVYSGDDENLEIYLPLKFPAESLQAGHDRVGRDAGGGPDDGVEGGGAHRVEGRNDDIAPAMAPRTAGIAQGCSVGEHRHAIPRI